MNEMPENLSDEEKEAWEKSLTAGSLPTWWKPNPADPAATGTARPPAAPAASPPVASAPAGPAPAPVPPAPEAEPLVKNAPPDWDHSRSAGSLPTWWKPGDPPTTVQGPPPAAPPAAAPPPAPAPPPPVAAAPPPAAPAPPAGAWVPPPTMPPPSAPVPSPAPPVPPATLHLERSEMEAATAPAAPAPAAPAPAAPAPAAPPDSVAQFQPTMVMGTFPAAPKTASIMVRPGPDTGAKFALETSPLYVGRAPDNGIVVNDPATSRRHARFELRAQDFLVVDLGSANGTLVDGVRVVEQVLANGTVVTMGQNEFVVSIS